MADFPDRSLRPPLPDVLSEAGATTHGALDWVGMDGIALPVRIDGADGQSHWVPAKVSAYVNLARDADRGIHMSRLYRALDQHLAGQAPTGEMLRGLLRDFLDSHADLSDRARVRLRFELPVRRRALLSALHGWRSYPVEVIAELDRNGLRVEAGVQVEYSSTCPGSAALARQLIQQQFERDFPLAVPPRPALLDWLGSSRGICATPHAQRSMATVRVRWARDGAMALIPLIDRIEAALGTAVQTAVKREDEQEFARLNGENPMYCEDAVRRIRAVLADGAEFDDYAIRAAHLESLHPHDAVAMAVRGVPGGFVAVPD